MTKLTKFLWLPVILACLIISTFGLWVNSRNTIAGEWNDPEIEILNVSEMIFEDAGIEVISCFFNITQRAKLRTPRIVNKGNAREREIAEQINRVAFGWETVVIRTEDRSKVYLPLSDHVTAGVCDEENLWLKTTWSYYSKEGIFCVNSEDQKVTQIEDHTESPAIQNFREFLPIEEGFQKALPDLRERLKTRHLGKPRAKNRLRIP